MTGQLKPELRAAAMLAKGLWRAVERGEDAGAGDMDWPADLAPEDRARLEQKRAILPEFFAALKDIHRGTDSAAQEAAKARVKALLKASKDAGVFLGFPEQAEALARAKDLEAFAAALPFVDLARTYGTGFHKVSPFPLIWAIAARGQQEERLRMMLAIGAPVDITTRLGVTVLHEFATMKRKAARRGTLLQMLVDHGADLAAQDIHGATPLARALVEGSEEDVAHFLAVGAAVTALELHWAAQRPERFGMILPYAAKAECSKARAKLDADIARFSEMISEAEAKRAYAASLIAHRGDLQTSRAFLN